MPVADTNYLPPRIRSHFSVDLADLVQPDAGWPYPLSIEQAFQAFAWMAHSGRNYRQERRGVTELLSATSGVGFSAVKPIKSLSDLRTRFHYALLGNVNEAQAEWRKDHGLELKPGASTSVPGPNLAAYRPFDQKRRSEMMGFTGEANVKTELERMLTGSRNSVMEVSLNEVHPDCRFLHGCHISVDYKGMLNVNLTYGTKLVDKDLSSYWTETIAIQRPKEPFTATLQRARGVFDALVHGQGMGVDFSDMYALSVEKLDLSRFRPVAMPVPFDQQVAEAAKPAPRKKAAAPAP